MSRSAGNSMTPDITRRAVLPVIGGGALAAARLPARAAGDPAPAGVPADRVAALARGFNLPDLVPATALRPNLPALLTDLRRRGFTHVRLPVRAENVMPRFAGAAVRGAALDDLDAALDLLIGRGYAVIVDLHPGGGLGDLYRRDPGAALAAVTDAWGVLAPRLRSRPASRVFAELLNEPPTSDAVWRSQAAELAGAVRALLPDTTLLVGPAPYERVEALADWTPLADRNVAYVCHFYDPMAFTHQGATWEEGSPSADFEGVPFPARLSDPAVGRILAALRGAGKARAARALETALASPWTVEAIGRQFAPVGAWARRHGVPVVLDEFGVLRAAASRTDRLLWLATVRRAAEAEGIGWSCWDFDEGFALVVDGRPDPGVVEALLGRNPRSPRRG